MILVSHPTGNQNVRALLRGLEASRLLHSFHTTLGWSRVPGAGILPARLRAQLARRTYDGIPGERIRTAPLRELVRLAAPHLGLSGLTRHETGWASTDSVYRALDRVVAERLESAGSALRGVYAFDDGASVTFGAAKELGLTRIYELPVGYWRVGLKLLEEERELQPAWAQTMDALIDSPEKFERKDQELRAAQHIVVPSSFVRGTLAAAQTLTGQIHVLPYGAPQAAAIGFDRRPMGPLRVLYVGSLDQRKGLAYLFEAMDRVGSGATLTLLGQKRPRHCPALDRALQRHNWVAQVPHSRALEIMRQHDLLVFPSLFDGFGLVILEAMAQGLPVIATTNSAAPDLITEGVDGFVVPIRDGRAIADRIDIIASTPTRLAAMSEAARCKAESLPWHNYERQVAELTASALNGRECGRLP